MGFVKEQFGLLLKMAIPFTVLYLIATGVGFIARNLTAVAESIKAKT